MFTSKRFFLIFIIALIEFNGISFGYPCACQNYCTIPQYSYPNCCGSNNQNVNVPTYIWPTYLNTPTINTVPEIKITKEKDAESFELM